MFGGSRAAVLRPNRPRWLNVESRDRRRHCGLDYSGQHQISVDQIPPMVGLNEMVHPHDQKTPNANQNLNDPTNPKKTLNENPIPNEKAHPHDQKIPNANQNLNDSKRTNHLSLSPLKSYHRTKGALNPLSPNEYSAGPVRGR